ncbi:MAG: hypothetical protein K1060chlam1_01066 [Candidatus Anoxychlamydiales bacterium]|nr:hypothetical protein [Candidatus Anoxychlamydiales bacterium]
MDPDFSFFCLSDIKRFFLKNKVLFLLAFIGFFFIAFFILVGIESKYTAQATFFEYIENSSPKTIGSLKDIVLSDNNRVSSDASSFFKSKSLAKKLVKKLALQISLEPKGNVFQRKCKIALKNLQFECRNKVEDSYDIEYESVDYKKIKPRFYYLRILDESFFEVLDLNKNILSTSKNLEEVKLKEISFKIKKIPKIFFNKTLKIRVDPIDTVAQKILKDIKIIKDKITPNYLSIKMQNPNLNLVAKSLNAMLNLYLEHLKEEQKDLVENQLKYLEKRKNNLEKDLFAFYEILEKYLKTNVKDSGFVNLDAEISTLLRKRETYLTSLNENIQELKYLKSFDLAKVETTNYLDENFIKLTDEIKRLKNKKKELLISIKKDDFDLRKTEKKEIDIEKTLFLKNSIDQLIDEVEKNRKFQNENNLNFSNIKNIKFESSINNEDDFFDIERIKQRYFDNNILNLLDISDAKMQIKELSNKKENAISEISQINQILKNIDKDSFQSSVANFLPDHLTKNINEIAKKLEDSKNYTIKEIEGLKEEYFLEKKIIRSYLENNLNLKNLSLRTLDQKLNLSKKIKLKLLNQEILFLSSKAKDYINEKTQKISDEKLFLEKKLNDLKIDMKNIVEKIAIEKKINLKSEMTKNMVNSLSKLIESKNLDFNLQSINSKIIDLASIPNENIKINVFRNSFILAILGFFITFIISLYIKAIKGFAISKEVIKSLNFDFFGKISFKCNGIDVDELKKKDLESLRKIVSSIKEKKQKVITALSSKGPNYIHYLASLLAISKKKVLVIETKSEIEEKNGLFPYLEKNIKKLPIQKMQAYDYIASGNQKYFAFELLKSLDFIQMIDNIKNKYDLVLIYSNAKLNSAEARIYLDFSDKIILSFKEESLDDLKPFLSWDKEKIKICFGTY